MSEKIKQKLEAALSPQALEIIDESSQHAGHAGWREGGESHFNVTIVSDRFKGMAPLARHRLVHDILKEEMRDIHALSITAKNP